MCPSCRGPVSYTHLDVYKRQYLYHNELMSGISTQFLVLTPGIKLNSNATHTTSYRNKNSMATFSECLRRAGIILFLILYYQQSHSESQKEIQNT